MSRDPDYTTLIDAEELRRQYRRPDLVLFDCRFDLADSGRGLQEYQQGHIPGARYAHLDQHLSSPITDQSGRHPLPHPGILCQWLQHQGVSNSSQVIAYDDSGGTMAVRLWWLLRWLGHDRVALLDGGWKAWIEANGPVSTAMAQTQPALFSARMRPEMTLDTKAIRTDLLQAQQDWLLMDVRTPERYRGEHEPIDPVAGHIPGAINLPLQENLGSEGRFLPAERLYRHYRQMIGDRSPARVVCYCGSGVTACHSILAMEIAGLSGARLYAGSWSEWIRDPERPIATASDPQPFDNSSSR